MDTSTTVIMAVLLLGMSMLYSSVGHGGASGYLAAMALLGIAPETMKPTALTLNIVVSSIAIVKFYRAGCFSYSLFLPFACASVPFAFAGGFLTLPPLIYRPVVGLILLYAALRLGWQPPATDPEVTKAPIAWSVGSGAGIGFLSGLIGIGGGILLTPLLLFMQWATARQAAGVSAAFILVNSISGLAGIVAHSYSLPAALPAWAVVVGVGGWVGSEYGSRRLASPTLRRLLALVLVIAGCRMIAAI